MKKLEMDHWRRYCRFSKMDRVTNEEIKGRMGAEKTSGIHRRKEADMVRLCMYEELIN